MNIVVMEYYVMKMEIYMKETLKTENLMEWVIIKKQTEIII